MGEGLLVEYTRLWNGFKRGLLQYLEDNRAELRDPSISHSYYDTFSDQLSATRKKLIELELGNPNVYNALERIAVGATKGLHEVGFRILTSRNTDLIDSTLRYKIGGIDNWALVARNVIQNEGGTDYKI